MPQSAGARLRTKTGCLTCRLRRKKCDETYPQCQRCATSRRKCEWPGAEDLIDRRHVAGRGRYASPSLPSASRASPCSQQATLAVVVRRPSLSLHSEIISSQIVRRDVEPLVSANFFDNYFDMIVLPNCHTQFYHGWIDEIKDLMTKHPSLYYSMLACSAAQVHSLSGTSQLHGLALEYYDRSIKYVSQMLDAATVATNNGLLMSVILLYLHGCLGRATFSDVPRHVDAAIGLLRLRLFSGHGTITRPFDRIAIESALYQIFLTATGSWLSPPTASLPLDTEFWSNAESLLPHADLFPSHSPSVNSPILGQPLPLFRLVLSAKHLYQHRHHRDPDALASLQADLAPWEALVLRNDDIDPLAAASNLSHYQLYKDATYLYILIASLLLTQATTPQLPLSPSPELNRNGSPSYAPEPSPHSWQGRAMTQILRRRLGDRDWATCFTSNWPLYTCGFFMEEREEQEMVRREMTLRTEVTGFSQAERFLEELEGVWAARRKEEGGGGQGADLGEELGEGMGGGLAEEQCVIDRQEG